MSSHNDLNHQLLRPCILQILRASGFHSTRPSVLDALVSIASNYLLLLGSRTAAHAYTNQNSSSPTITDVRMAFEDCGVFATDLTASEEAWKELLRRPLSSYDERTGAREKERQRRELEDLAAVKEWCEWWVSGKHQEIRRVAGLEDKEAGEDYLSVLKKKHSKTGEESRYQGTVLGIPAEDRPIKIEGGPAETLEEWMQSMRRQTAKRAANASMNAVASANAHSERSPTPVDATMEDTMEDTMEMDKSSDTLQTSDPTRNDDMFDASADVDAQSESSEDTPLARVFEPGAG